MLWRASYSPDVRNVDLGDVPFVAGCRPSAFREMEVWRRLFAAAGNAVELRVEDQTRKDAEAYFGRAVQTDQPIPNGIGERSCGYVPGLLVIGNPTEEVWQRMLAALGGSA